MPDKYVIFSICMVIENSRFICRGHVYLKPKFPEYQTNFLNIDISRHSEYILNISPEILEFPDIKVPHQWVSVVLFCDLQIECGIMLVDRVERDLPLGNSNNIVDLSIDAIV